MKTPWSKINEEAQKQSSKASSSSSGYSGRSLCLDELISITRSTINPRIQIRSKTNDKRRSFSNNSKTMENNPSTMMSQKTCTDCSAPSGRSLWTFWNKGDYRCNEDEEAEKAAATTEQAACPKNARLCTKCHCQHPLFVVPPKGGGGGGAQHSDDNDDQMNDISKGKIHLFCKSCLQQKSSLDFSRTYDATRCY
jgi:hypothetical protein